MMAMTNYLKNLALTMVTMSLEQTEADLALTMVTITMEQGPANVKE